MPGFALALGPGDAGRARVRVGLRRRPPRTIAISEARAARAGRGVVGRPVVGAPRAGVAEGALGVGGAKRLGVGPGRLAGRPVGGVGSVGVANAVWGPVEGVARRPPRPATATDPAAKRVRIAAEGQGGVAAVAAVLDRRAAVAEGTPRVGLRLPTRVLAAATPAKGVPVLVPRRGRLLAVRVRR